MGDDEHGPAGRRLLAQQVGQPVAHAGVEALLGLVEDQQGAGPRQHGGQQEPAALPGGERLGQRVGAGLQAEVLQQHLDDAARVGHAVPDADEFQVLAHGQGGEERLVPQVHGERRTLGAGALVDGAAQHAHRARQGGEDAGDRAQQRGLAGAVRAHDGQHLAGRHAQGDRRAHRRVRAVADEEVAGLHQRLGGGGHGRGVGIGGHPARLSSAAGHLVVPTGEEVPPPARLEEEDPPGAAGDGRRAVAGAALGSGHVRWRPASGRCPRRPGAPGRRPARGANRGPGRPPRARGRPRGRRR